MCYFYILAFDLADVASPLLQIKNNLALTIRMRADRSLHLFKQLTLGNKIKLNKTKQGPKNTQKEKESFQWILLISLI